MNKLTYDQAFEELQTIVNDLEKGELISMEDYIQKAKRSKELLDYCRKQLTGLETELDNIFSQE